MPTFDTPIDEIYWIRQQISAQYDHDPHKYHLAMVEEQKRLAREGQVFWGYNAAGELAPLPKDAILGALPTTSNRKLEMKGMPITRQ